MAPVLVVLAGMILLTLPSQANDIFVAIVEDKSMWYLLGVVFWSATVWCACRYLLLYADIKILGAKRSVVGQHKGSIEDTKPITAKDHEAEQKRAVGVDADMVFSANSIEWWPRILGLMPYLITILAFLSSGADSDNTRQPVSELLIVAGLYIWGVLKLEKKLFHGRHFGLAATKKASRTDKILLTSFFSLAMGLTIIV